MEIAWAIFHADGYLPWANDLLNIILSGFAIFSGDIFNISWLMRSEPHALFWIKSMQYIFYFILSYLNITNNIICSILNFEKVFIFFV